MATLLVEKNSKGIYLQSNSKNNSIYHNNFIKKPNDNNFKNAKVSASTPNSWNENYWSDYREKYGNVISSSNGVTWDEPYVIDPYSAFGIIDYHPWVNKNGNIKSKIDDMKVKINVLNLRLLLFKIFKMIGNDMQKIIDVFNVFHN